MFFIFAVRHLLEKIIDEPPWNGTILERQEFVHWLIDWPVSISNGEQFWPEKSFRNYFKCVEISWFLCNSAHKFEHRLIGLMVEQERKKMKTRNLTYTYLTIFFFYIK